MRQNIWEICRAEGGERKLSAHTNEGGADRARGRNADAARKERTQIFSFASKFKFMKGLPHFPARSCLRARSWLLKIKRRNIGNLKEGNGMQTEPTWKVPGNLHVAYSLHMCF